MFEILLLLILIFLIIPFLIQLIVSIWVYIDAKRHEINFFAWILIVWLIPFLIGLVVYIFFKEKYSDLKE